MSDGNALLKAILANPAEDTPRLMYADWLQENGQQERAEFIRRGVKKPGSMFVDNVPHLIAERGVGQFLDRWSRLVVRGWLPPPPIGQRCNVRFRRGFADQVACPAAWWLTHGDTICAAHPVERVTLTTWPGETVGWNARVVFTPDYELLRPDGTVSYDHWPRVAFTLPTPEYGPSPLRGDYAAFQQELARLARGQLAQLARGLGLPPHLIDPPT